MLEKNGNRIKKSEFSGGELYSAVKSKHWEVARLFIRRNVLIHQEIAKNSALFKQAYKNNDWITVKRLVRHGADVNVHDKREQTALHRAVQKRKTNVVNTLLQHGAKVDLKDKKGRTAIDIARKCSNQEKRDEIIRLLQPAPSLSVYSGMSNYLMRFFDAKQHMSSKPLQLDSKQTDSGSEDKCKIM